MKCLRSIWDCKIQICRAKAICLLLGYLFCFKVTNQIKFSINVSLVSWYRTMTLDFEIECLFGMYQVLQGHLLWLEVGMVTLSGNLWYRPLIFLILKSIFSLILGQVLQGLDTFSMMTCLLYRTKDVNFETKFLSGMCQVFPGHFLWLEVHMVMLLASFWYRSRDCDFEINFLYECVPSAWSILIISVVSHVPFCNLTLKQVNWIWFWN